MNVMILAQCYAPEEVSGAVLVSELATDLIKYGHKVSVITVAPNYPYGRIYPGYKNRIIQKEILENVCVIRTWSYISPKKTFWKRIFHYGTHSASAFYGGLFAGKPDLLVCFSPPLPLCVTACLLSRLWRVPWVLQLEDLYPDAAVNAGILSNPKVIAFFSKIERFVYRHATHISVICECFHENLQNKGVPDHKITVIPVWADHDAVKPLPKNNHFRKKNHLKDKFVVMYAGNLGHTSCLEDVLECARLLKYKSNIHFIMVGEGVKKEALMQFAQENELINVTFLPYQPRENFSEMLAAADISLVTLNERSHLSSLPSKTFNIMASARPILAVAPSDSEITHLVKETKCGISISPGNPEKLANTILNMERYSKETLDTLGQNGRTQLVGKYSRVKCVRDFEQMISKII